MLHNATQLEIQSENIMYHIVANWAKKRYGESWRHLSLDILKRLRFMDMTPGYLLAIKNEYVNGPFDLVTKIMTAMEYHRGSLNFPFIL